ncbi:MAG: sulfatase [Armatimonadetes bacterium]|nr:sulfatase [Armatimonadota bacterium]
MRGPLTLLVCALTGTIVGGWVGHRQGADLWPELSRLHLVWTCAVGWAVGVVVGLGLLLLAIRRPRSAARQPAGWATTAATALLLLAFLPLALWLTYATPGGLMREAAPVHRALGERRPNIILISIDALRPDFLGCYGNASGLTPNIDAFAAESTVYEAAYAPASWTMASFGALFAGQVPSSSITMRDSDEHPVDYVRRARVYEDVSLLPEELWSAGYRTAAELTNPFLTNHFGWGRGFEYFRNEDAADPDLLLASETARAEVITRNAAAWVRLNHYEPFLLWVHYLDPHAPYDAPGTAEKTDGDYPTEWKTSRAYWEEHIAPAPLEIKRRYASFCQHRYGEEVAYVDAWFGRLLDQIRDDGHYDDCLIAVFADHGEELFDHEGFDHGHSLHEEVLRVPLIIRWPRGVAADSRVTQTVALLDLNTTVFELADCQLPEGQPPSGLAKIDGVPGAEVYSEGLLHTARQTALTTDAWKLIYTPGQEGEGHFEVYDRTRDRGELHDLAQTGVATELRESLRRLTEEMALAQDERGAPAGVATELGAEARRQLQSLGYLSD